MPRSDLSLSSYDPGKAQMNGRRFIDDPVSTNLFNYLDRLEKRVSYNAVQGNWDRAERWARLWWEIAQVVEAVVCEREDA